MYEIELIVFALSAFQTVRFFLRWYGPIAESWPPQRSFPTRFTLSVLPVLAVLILLFTLTGLASFDVVDSGFYILFYILLGYAWISLGMFLITVLLDLSWQDDALWGNNRAALFPVAAGFLAVTLIYAGANVGDGPGWWCVVFAAGLGLAAWLGLALLVSALTGTVERITVGRDPACALRYGGYLLACGILLGRASSGDWTSFSMTVIEFSAGWPVLPLTAVALPVELLYLLRERRNLGTGRGEPVVSSALLGNLYVLSAAAAMALLP